ncbi:MAG: hypothetical protein J2P25_01050 [Nocardiopsaceae bacterium]|nr:hypothetical protein [Nocardiopsaceae bacterium]
MNESWRLPREYEEPFRDALDHAAKRRIGDLHALLRGLTEQQATAAISLCGYVSAYIAIDVVERRWPTDAAVRRMAQKLAEVKVDRQYGVTEENVYLYLSKCALGFQSYADVFGDAFGSLEETLAAPFFFATDMLAGFLPKNGQTIWEFLDVIEDAYEKAWLLDLNLLPALMVRARMPQPEGASDGGGGSR